MPWQSLIPVAMSCRTVLLSLFMLVAGQARGSKPERVIVKIFGEAGCPDTTAFIFGPLATAQKAAGVAQVLHLEWIPFGNAYFITKTCGGVQAPLGCHDSSSCLYNGSVRDCYFEHCGLGSHIQLADCYGPGLVRCQHGPTECAANRVEACAKFHAPSFYWNISMCIEKAFYTGRLRNGDSEQEVLKWAHSCGVGQNLLNSCYSTAVGDRAVEDMAKQTPPHSSVPFLLINDVPLQDTSQFLAAVCKAYSGPLPEGCLPLIV